MIIPATWNRGFLPTTISVSCELDVTREASAVQAAADLLKWVESGPVMKVEWYLVDVSQSCPVSIDSLTEEECTEDQCVEGCVAVCRTRR